MTTKNTLAISGALALMAAGAVSFASRAEVKTAGTSAPAAVAKGEPRKCPYRKGDARSAAAPHDKGEACCKGRAHSKSECPHEKGASAGTGGK